MAIFLKFTEHDPRFDRASAHTMEVIPGNPELGAAIGVEFIQDDGTIPWVGVKVPDNATGDQVAEALELLAQAVRNKEWCTNDLGELRAGREIVLV